MKIWKSFFEFGQWWFAGRVSQPVERKTNRVVTCDIHKAEIKRVMRENRCVGYMYKSK